MSLQITPQVLSITGTANQIVASTPNGAVTLSTPQNIGTASDVQFSSVKTANIFPPSDSTTAIQLNKADGTTNVLNVDTTNARVGIGTTTPLATLDVRGGTASFSGQMKLIGTAAGDLGNAYLGVYDNNNRRIGFVGDYAAANSNFGIGADVGKLDFLTSGSTQMTIDTSGNVGIGVTPTHLFQVNTSDAAKPGVGGLWTVVSDKRIKKDIGLADLDRCYEIVKTIPLKRFAWEDGVYTEDQVPDRHNLGFIAQDVQPIFSKATPVTSFTKANGEVIKDCLNLDAGQINMALYGAVQKLQGMVEDLTKQLTELQAKIYNS
jgi:hypothetical protein